MATPVRTIDIAPTILELVAAPAWEHAQGVSLVGLMTDADAESPPPVYAESFEAQMQYGLSALRSWTTDDWKYIHTSAPELYDLAADPRETRNLIETNPERAAQALADLRQLIADAPPTVVEDDTANLSPEGLKALESLGYIGTGNALADDAAREIDRFEPTGADPRIAARFLKPAAWELPQLMQQKRHADAERLIRQMLAAMPASAYLQGRLAEVIGLQGRVDDAVEAFDRAVEMAPDDATMRRKYGEFLQRVGRIDAALVQYRSVLQQSPDDTGALQGAGLALSDLDQFDEARQHLQVALELDERNARTLRIMGLVAEKEGKLPEALQWYGRALEIEPDFTSCEQDRRRVLKQMGVVANVSISPWHEATRRREFMSVKERKDRRSDATASPPSKGGDRGLLIVFVLIVIFAPAVWFALRVVEPSPTPTEPPTNLLLITLDTTRTDHLSCYGGTATQTPHLDKIAAEGTRFAYCTSCSPITLPSHASILTGLYPYAHGARQNGTGRLAPANETLTEILKDAGLQTRATVASFVLNAQYGTSQGFDEYRDVTPDAGTAALAAERKGDVICDDALEMLEDVADQPFFMWVHFYDPHHPYISRRHPDVHSAEAYADEVAYMDEQIGRLMSKVSALGLDGNTLVVVVADHGEGLGQHEELQHGNFIYDTTIHVALLMRYPGLVPAGHTVDTHVRTVDIAPTILELMGQPELERAQGSSYVGAAFG